MAAEKARVANRIQKVLEEANLKLGSVASDLLGKSGRALLAAIAAGETDPEKLAELALRRLRSKKAPLRQAWAGRVTDHHRFLVQLLLDQVASREGLIGRWEARIAAVRPPFAEAVQRLTTIPGVGRQGAEAVVAEVGTDRSVFPRAGHLASWAGVCPGHDQSAGKRRSGRTTKGSRWLRTVLVQAAWSASHSKGTYLRARYQRLARRRGRKRALLGVAHSLLGIIYQVLKQGTTYQEPGADYFDRQESERWVRHLVKRLESLGQKVTLEPTQEVA